MTPSWVWSDCLVHHRVIKAEYCIGNSIAMNYYTVLCLPAVHYDGPSVGWVQGLNPLDEKEEGCGVIRYIKIRPDCEMELGHNAFLTAATLQEQRRGGGTGKRGMEERRE